MDISEVKTVQDYLKFSEGIAAQIESLRKLDNEAYAIVSELPVPAKLRPATAKDIVFEAVLWYPHWEGQKWAIVEEVRHPDDDWKAYVFNGARYGLHGAFVEVVE